MTIPRISPILGLLFLSTGYAATPIPDIFPDPYPVSQEHLEEGAARYIELENTSKVIFGCLGMSNQAQECDSNSRWGWTPSNPNNIPLYPIQVQAFNDSLRQSGVEVVNGAFSSETTLFWSNPNGTGWNNFRSGLSSRGATVSDVGVVWHKPVIPWPSGTQRQYIDQVKPIAADAFRTMTSELPNLKIMLCSERIYGGYPNNGLHGEPYAYATGIACEELRQEQIAQENGATTTGPQGDLRYSNGSVAWLDTVHLWAEGTTPRGDGLVWLASDLSDGIHPSRDGRVKVSSLLLGWMHEQCWYRNDETCGNPPPPEPDADGDGVPDSEDACPNEPGPASNAGCPLPPPPPDSDGDGVPDVDDDCPNDPGPASNNGCPTGEDPPSNLQGSGGPTFSFTWDGDGTLMCAGSAVSNPWTMPSSLYGSFHQCQVEGNGTSNTVTVGCLSSSNCLVM